MKKISTEIRSCVQCQASYKPVMPWQLACSEACGIKYQNGKKPRFTNDGTCRRCNASLEGRRKNVLYCTRTCKSLDFNFYHRYKSRFTGKARRMEIIERDGWTCYVCDSRLDFDQIELDHLIPDSRNGSSESNNLAVSCMPCNRSRGNRIGVRQLEKLQELRSRI